MRGRAVDLVLGIEYDPMPVPRQRDVDRQDLLRRPGAEGPEPPEP